MKVYILTVLSILLINFKATAQFEESNESSNQESTTNAPKTKPQPAPLKERILLGGGLDVRFGDITVIGVTPLIGYKVTDRLIAGLNLTYRYVSYNYLTPTYSTSTYGVAPFARFDIFRGLFAHAEYEFLRGEFYFNDDPRWINSLLIGGGYDTPIGSNGFIGAYVLWNITPDSNPDYHIYKEPQLRLSFGIGL